MKAYRRLWICQETRCFLRNVRKVDGGYYRGRDGRYYKGAFTSREAAYACLYDSHVTEAAGYTRQAEECLTLAWKTRRNERQVAT